MEEDREEKERKKGKKVKGEGIRVGGKGWLLVLRGMDAAGPYLKE